MDGDIEAAGALVTASGVAAAVEPARSDTEVHDEACANCGAMVHGRYCAQCGQVAHVHRSLAHAVEELLHGVWHFDSKLWNTLPMLVTRPGKLTRDYVMGRRVRYISPFALFLLTIFLMFFVFGLPGGAELPNEVEVNIVNKQALQTADGKARLAELDRSIADIDRDMLGATAIEAPFDLPSQGVRVCFVNLPNSQIELIEPLGEDSPVHAFLAKNPRGGLGLGAEAGAGAGRHCRELTEQGAECESAPGADKSRTRALQDAAEGLQAFLPATADVLAVDAAAVCLEA